MSHPAGFHLLRLSEGRLYICTVPVIATVLYIVFIFSSIVPYPESYTQEKFKIQTADQTADKGPSTVLALREFACRTAECIVCAHFLGNH